MIRTRSIRKANLSLRNVSSRNNIGLIKLLLLLRAPQIVDNLMSTASYHSKYNKDIIHLALSTLNIQGPVIFFIALAQKKPK